MRKIFSKAYFLYWIVAISILFLMCFVLLYFSEAPFPATFKSGGVVAIISAVIGVVLTAFAVSFQLKQKSEAEEGKDKIVKIYEQKIRVFSVFTSKMWKMANDVESDVDALNKKYNELRLMCFDKLMFFLKQDEIELLTKIIEKIDTTKPMDYNLSQFCKITNILQDSLENKHENESYLKNLYDAFDQKDALPKEEIKHASTAIKDHGIDYANITFWHFIMFGDEQIKAFKNNNWLLSLIEYEDEDWRTNLLRQVRENDVVFLFRRGGAGYIGAFRAKETKVFTSEEWDQLRAENKREENARYDIYDAFDDGATLVSNIIVEPIAYNCRGVGYYTIRRRTIERMNDTETVKFLLDRFNGNHLTDDRLIGKGKLDNETPVKLDENYFSGIIRARFPGEIS